jgi:hypothetical protein
MTRNRREPIVIYCEERHGPWSWLFHAIYMSRVSHILLADEHAVLDIHHTHGVLFRPHYEYWECNCWTDCLLLGDDLPSPRLYTWEGGDPPITWRSVVKYLSLGLVPYDGDCVGIAREALSRMEINVPFWVTTPGGIIRWLKRKGYGQRNRPAQSPTDKFKGPGRAVR